MSYCGKKKRREWVKEISNSATERECFYFRFPGHTIEVPSEDSFAMMSVVDLKVRT